MDKSCTECIHHDVCGIAPLYGYKPNIAQTCTKYMCMAMAWDWLNDLRSQGKKKNIMQELYWQMNNQEVNKDE